MILYCFKSRYIHQINRTLSAPTNTALAYELKWIAELLTSTEMNLKLIYFTVIVLQTETIAIVLLYFFLGIYKKGLVVLYGFFLSLEAKVDCSQSSVFRIFSHCQRSRNVKSTWQFNERGVFSLVFRWREDPCTFLIVVSIKYFCPKLRKQFASKFLRRCSIMDVLSGLLGTIPLFRDHFYRDCFLTLRRRWVRVTEARDWSDQLNCQYRVGAITTNSATE